MSRWKKGKLIDLININTNVKLTKGKKYPFVSMDVIQPFYKPVEAKEEREFNSGGARFENGDTLFARITPCLENGKIAQVKNLRSGVGFGSTEFLVLRGKEGITDTDFVYYLSINRSFRENAERLMVGTSGRQRVDKQQFENLVITIPDIETQKRIASILSGIDSKIELNVKMNQTLEEMAMTLYKHRFIDFGPIQDGEFIESELGMIPKGWEIKKLSDLVNTQYGYTESATEKKIGPHFLRITDIQDRFISWDRVPYCPIDVKDYEKYKLNKGDIVIARTGNSTGAVGYINSNIEAVYASFLVRLTPKTDYLSTHFLYLLTTSKEYQSYIERAGTGSARKGANAKLMTNYYVVIPPKEIMAAFHKKVDNIFEKIEKNIWENINLKNIRDYLLPRLISGEIDVTKAKKHAEEVL